MINTVVNSISKPFYREKRAKAINRRQDTVFSTAVQHRRGVASVLRYIGKIGNTPVLNCVERPIDRKRSYEIQLQALRETV